MGAPRAQGGLSLDMQRLIEIPWNFSWLDGWHKHNLDAANRGEISYRAVARYYTTLRRLAAGTPVPLNRGHSFRLDPPLTLHGTDIDALIERVAREAPPIRKGDARFDPDRACDPTGGYALRAPLNSLRAYLRALAVKQGLVAPPPADVAPPPAGPRVVEI